MPCPGLTCTWSMITCGAAAVEVPAGVVATPAGAWDAGRVQPAAQIISAHRTIPVRSSVCIRRKATARMMLVPMGAGLLAVVVGIAVV